MRVCSFCGNSKTETELQKIRAEALEYARKKSEIVIIYKWMGFYRFGLAIPSDASLVEYVSPS